MEETLLQVFPFGVVGERRYLSAAASLPSPECAQVLDWNVSDFQTGHRIAKMSYSFLLDEATVASGKFTAPGASPALTGQEQQGGCAQLIRERWTMQEKDGRVQAMAR